MTAEKPVITGFLQIRNELSSGHLKRFVELNCGLFDHLAVLDDGSDDGSENFIK